MGGAWGMVGRLFTLSAMPAATPDLSSHLNESIVILKSLIEKAELQLQDLRMQAPQEPQAMAPAVPVTIKKMPRGAIVDTIATQLPIFLASCIEQSREMTGGTALNTIIKYHVNEFRKHCELFLPIGTADLEKGCDGMPKWISRFNRAHREAVKRRRFIPDGTGGWTISDGYQ